ncbi:MAG TPA: hypothetical protein VK879_18075 [Candidatus Sulfomarinibacteraceae bacterium]|nr:hypothetical protein [Candidatus Sulfomarinibacteraceae bacterium]
MSDNRRQDIRRLLKTFGVRADETISAYLEEHGDVEELRVRVTLEDLTDYEGSPPGEPLRLEVEETIRNS